jgi:hypothetical protein
MNVFRTSVICMISLMTVTSGLSEVQSRNIAVSKAFIASFAADDTALKDVDLQPLDLHFLCSYEPPPDIGGPKRTGGSGGRYINNLEGDRPA